MSKPTVRVPSPKAAPETSTPVMNMIDTVALIDAPSTTETALTPPVPAAANNPRKRRALSPALAARRFPAAHPDEHASNHQAELFYLQKQIQTQTQMVFILEDGQRIQGVIEWYDRNSIKVRGRSRVLIYKSAIKYIHKTGENGHD